MKQTKVIYLSPAHSSNMSMKKRIRFADDENKKSNHICQRYCGIFWYCSKCLPYLIVSLLVCATVVGIVLALKFSYNPILNNQTTIISSTDQTSSSTTSGKTTLSMSSSVTSTSLTSSTVITSATSTTTMATLCSDWTWNATGITIAGSGSSGSALNQLSSPWNIYLDSQTNILYIADSQNHRIVKWLPNASSGIVIAGTGSLGSQSNQLNTPKDVFVDSSDNLYVADTNNQRVQFFPSGSLVASTISTNWSAGNLYGVFMYNNSIYACDYTNGAVWRNGTAVAGNQGLGSNVNQLNYPQGFTVDTLYNKGTMYIANSQQHTIVQWLPGASTGTVVAGTNGVASSSNTTFNFPLTVKIDSFSNLFVVDNNNHRVQLYCRYPNISSTGRTIAGQTGLSGTSSIELTYPAGVAFDSSMNLYVSDTSNHRIQKFMRLS